MNSMRSAFALIDNLGLVNHLLTEPFMEIFRSPQVDGAAHHVLKLKLHVKELEKADTGGGIKFDQKIYV